MRGVRFLLPALLTALLVAGGSAPVAEPKASATPKELKETVARAIAAEKAALKALDTNTATVRSKLESSLSDLRAAKAGASAAGGGDAVHSLDQAILDDEDALNFLGKPLERHFVHGRINIAIIRKE